MRFHGIKSNTDSRRGGLAALVMAGLAALPLMFGGSGQALAADPIKIGFLGSLTGPLAVLGENGRLAMELAVKDLNAGGGIAGRQVELVMADDQGNPTQALLEARRLAFQERVVALIGPLITPLVVASLPASTEAKVLQFSVIGSSGAVNPEKSPYNFSVLAEGELHGVAAANYMAKVLSYKKVGVLYDNLPTSKEVLETFKATAKAAGMEITGEQSFQAQQEDMTPSMLALRRTNPEAIFLITAVNDAIGRVFANRDEIKWPVHIVAQSSVAYFPTAMKIAGPDAYKNTSGMFYTAFTYCPGTDVASSPYAKFYVKLKTFVGEEKLKKLIPTYMASFYDAAHVIKQAVEASGGKTDGPTLASWIEANGAKLSMVSIPTNEVSVNKTHHFFMSDKSLLFIRDVGPVDDYGMRPRTNSCK